MIGPFYLDLTEREIEDIQRAMGEILRSGVLILGKYTKEFEAEFARYVGTKYAVALNTCTSALEVLLTIKRVRGKRVAVPTNTNFATVAAILRAGGMPVFMDMTKEYFVPNLDILKRTVEKNPDIAGVVWVHIGGVISPDFPQVVEFCRSRGLFLLEDCAHAHGSALGGVKAGNFGDGGAFSFFPTKVMTTMEGGMITTNSKEEADLARSLRNQGKRDGDYGGLHYDLGSSWRMTEISAYMGLVMLNKLDAMVAKRQRAVDLLLPTIKDLGLAYVDTSHMDQASHYKFIVVFKGGESLESLKQKFQAEGVLLGGGVYEVPCHRQPVFRDIPFDPEDVRTAEEYCPRHICPPITSGLRDEDVDKIATAMKRVFGEVA
jgi:dTDP-4-amino-4,6-dideoxygalactose transaminase